MESRVYFYDVYVSADKCCLPAPLHVFQGFIQNSVCSPNAIIPKTETDKKSWQTLISSLRVLPVIWPTLLGFALSQLLCGHLPLRSTRRFLLEFLLIATPTVCSTTVVTDYNELYCLLVGALIAILIWRWDIWKKAKDPICLEIGSRPVVFTLMRANAYFCTASAILAIDFNAFPSAYFKSQAFGASVMDLGIGMFVVTMGIVSQRARHLGDVKRLPKVVAPLLVLGLARTVIITLIDYHQDEREYGKHLNAFFTLGLTKLFGSLCSLLAREDRQLLPLSLVILALHELLLQLGLSEFVMSSDVDRIGLWHANREGLSSLPGCVALYLLSIYCAKWYTSRTKLSRAQFWVKLRHMLLSASMGWLLVICCNCLFGIARVTFNAGYVLWLFSVTTTTMMLYAFLFEFLLLAPRAEDRGPNPLPAFVEAINMNGLTHFMLSNFLTGFVNMALKPRDRSLAESVAILMLYLLTSTGAVYVLFRKSVRIA
ncbi:GPI-anchored wall transfer protein 1 [Drosophila grimshawi]|uniref:GPI-anchored wall transfer protein 1 n=1 Tax=Drosophila grimshawi TaxID=7222 RepID=UPI001C935591|nr:GPI-anchored wall transfer protein 1 [Drosophila grimshawi]